jgi:anhydro-N-acetylmuramic acid kinase
MSGTSLDGIDVALIDTDGEAMVARGPSLTVPYDADFRIKLQRAISEARALTDRADRPGLLGAVEIELTHHHADAVQSFLKTRGLHVNTIGIVSFHGQTVRHVRSERPADRWRPAVPEATKPHMALGAFTVQLGDGKLLAELIGIDVVFDLRAADAAAGGEGAPLAPAYHRALAARLHERPVAFLNIGGVANVTWIGPEGELLAFDTGPGNALIDDWMQRHCGVPRDTSGALAAAGHVQENVVTQYLRHCYFGEPPPKSLDRDTFPIELVDGLSAADGAATLTGFTAASIARAREHFPKQPSLWLVCGGGRRNKTLMTMLAGRIESPVAPAEALGFDGDAMEAEAWAYLAVRSLKGLPITFPGTTGVPHPITGGVLAKC